MMLVEFVFLFFFLFLFLFDIYHMIVGRKKKINKQPFYQYHRLAVPLSYDIYQKEKEKEKRKEKQIQLTSLNV